MTAPRREHTRFCQWREKGECTCGSGAIVEAPRREGLSDDELRVFLAQEPADQEDDLAQAVVRDLLALRTAAREWVKAQGVRDYKRDIYRESTARDNFEQLRREYNDACAEASRTEAKLRALVAQEDR